MACARALSAEGRAAASGGEEADMEVHNWKWGRGAETSRRSTTRTLPGRPLPFLSNRTPEWMATRGRCDHGSSHPPVPKLSSGRSVCRALERRRRVQEDGIIVRVRQWRIVLRIALLAAVGVSTPVDHAAAHPSAAAGSSRAASAATQARTASVAGVVYDSLADGPLADADVQLLSDGAGAHVYNARTEIRHATRSRRTIVASLGPNDSAGERGTLLLGAVRDAATGDRLSDAVVSVQWSALAVQDSRLASVRQGNLVPVNPDGHFAICSLPLDAALTLRAAA